MNELKLYFDSKISKRFTNFLQSENFLEKQNLTEHWFKRKKANSEAFVFDGNELTVKSVDSGLADLYSQNFRSFKRNRSIKEYIKKWVLNRLGVYSGFAYDPLYNFNQFWPNGKGKIAIKDIIEEFGKIDNYAITKNCYFYNEIHEINETPKLSFNRVLEIGPGPGNLLRMIKKFHSESRIVIIDLPTSLPYSIAHILQRFPNATFCLPHEAKAGMDMEVIDFMFLTNSQASLIPANYFDLAVNTTSFQEMNKETINTYFDLLRKVMKKDNLFYCLNAVEKNMIYNDKMESIRFFDYPWLKEDFDYKYEISPVERGRTSKPFYVRAVKLVTNN